MELTFWLIVTAMTGLALWIIVPPLFKLEKTEDSGLDEQNINIARQRLTELKTQFETGAINESQYQEQYSELERVLNDDLGLSTQQTDGTATGRWLVAPLAAGIPLFAVSLYLTFGNFEAIEIAASDQPSSQQPQSAAAPPDINAMVTGLEAKLKQQPDDAQGWLMLGRSYKHLQQFQKASDAFAQALRLLGGQPDLLLQYADVLAMANGGSLKGKPTEMIYKAIKQSPDHQTGLWLAGMAKAESGAYSEALQYWQRLKKVLPAGSESYQELMGLITKVEAQLPDSEIVKAEPSPNLETAVNAEMQVKVTLSQSMENKTKPDHTVFIYAQAMKGPKMPLAIVREQVKNLPVTVVLSDQQAMSPMMKLSSFGQVKLIARISKTGSAMPQKSDLIGEVGPISTTENKLTEIEISREIE
jgi:cytochrome c-type biogenesis protein CcmH